MISIFPPKNKEVSGVLNIPASKSISNRCLIIKAMSTEEILLENLSISEDTKVLLSALHKVKNSTHKQIETIDIGIAGTAFRFLTAYLSTQKGTWILKGHQRINERPIEPLAIALKALGADIEYLEKQGFAPLLIKGKKLNNQSDIHIDASVSSQFITALLLIVPQIEYGITINLIGKISSLPYIKMTLSVMKHFGIESTFIEKQICVKKQAYQSNKLFIEADWSSASYFYQTLTLADKGSLILKNYSKNSIQGDSKLVDMFEDFGIKTIFQDNQITLTKTVKKINNFTFDFSEQPDLAQTFISLCSALSKKAKLTGLESLIIKETDRIFALNNELNKVGWQLKTTNKRVYLLSEIKNFRAIKTPKFETYNDHRMAMCLAPLSLQYHSINIANPDVVVKSNPLFWEQMKEIGFTIETT